jgi:hypothetical protein
MLKQLDPSNPDFPWPIAWIVVTLSLVVLADFQPGMATSLAFLVLLAIALTLQSKGAFS